MHLGNIKDGTNQSRADWFPSWSWGGACDLWGSGGERGGIRVPYLRGHSANGGQVIPSAQEVWCVDLQLKVAQPLDNGL